ncbi:MAG: alpha-glucan family phosphorylase [Prevotellaceae bacterium]|jgi:phosphorylase/glycogen(starch) synthase|nr:alpha-glucan family phosphorylase [Prevotellaceae bacterium]
MKKENLRTPDYLFEVSWEVCNKVGGIHTVVSTKTLNMAREVKNHITIGPDLPHESGNAEFTEDAHLLKAWRFKVQEEGLRIRVGRWNIAGSPIAILVDYTTFISQKDAIFSEFWELYKLDSISGQWDYTEPALFGYATAKVIESYVRFNVEPRHSVAAIFHEWMTGAGLLYLKSKVPQVGTLFITHATVMGRCIAGNSQPLYDNIQRYNADIKAREFNLTAKQSLEKCSAQNADCFSTVSEITARECKYFLGKEVDIVTPNGFDNSFVPADEDFDAVRRAGRKKLLDVAEALLCEKPADDALLVGIGGRYEFKNKGIDVFVQALGQLNADANLTRTIYAFIMVPAGHHGPRKDLLHNLENPDNRQPLDDRYTTHSLVDSQYDPVLSLAKQVGLTNSAGCKVNLFFIPSYLNGADGVLNTKYYDLLIGLDFSMFPSYYEPWGYTPMEAVAFRVPTITTSLAGFGLWVKTYYRGEQQGIAVIERTDANDAQVVNEMVKKVLSLASRTEAEMEDVRANAHDVSKIALWDNLIDYYMQALSIALSKVDERHELVLNQTREELTPYIDTATSSNLPTWNRIIVNKSIPEKLARLEELTKNLWWCWNQDAVDLFKSIDKMLWVQSSYNPIQFLDMLSLARYRALEEDKEFMKRLEVVYARYRSYMAQKSALFDEHAGNSATREHEPEHPETKKYKIAYFSMEYGLHTSLKIYSGGLGILAGDYLKEASDKGTPMVGVGLLYRYGYFAQTLTAAGDQVASPDEQDFTKIPASPVRDADNKWVTIQVAMPGRTVNARVWRVDVGRTELYLLDTDFEENRPEDRSITHQLYGGNWENRLKQELILGVGGIRALRALNVSADVYHCNEGHAAFIGLERIREYVSNKHLTFAEALEVVRASSLFTTHTPVPAGHDAFDEGLLRTYISHYPQRLKTKWEDLMKLGKVNVQNPGEKFSMSNLACSCSQEVNGVSWLHGKVSREILCGMWPGYLPEELHIGYVTNGVHWDTWTSNEWKQLQLEKFGDAFATHHYDKRCFDAIYKVDDQKIWNLRQQMRSKLIRYIRQRLSNSKIQKYHTPRELVEIGETLREDILTIGFARRFATYKRAHLLFKNLDRLDAIVNNPQMPVQFVFAGKAHPNDKPGQDLIKRIVEISRYPKFIGKILFLQNYDIRVSRKMVAGVDVWMNTPTRPLEASGTSGEKAVMNGVMNLSVLDGWWVEGYKEGAGWALPMERAYDNQDFQDDLDSETIYGLIENEIAPKFYNRNEKGIPTEWVGIIKKTIADVASDFTTNRMLRDYEDRYYDKLAARHALVAKNDFAAAKEIADWKRRVGRHWKNIEVLSNKQIDMLHESIVLGRQYELELQLDLAVLNPDDVGVELVMGEQQADSGQMSIAQTTEYACVAHHGSEATYALKISFDKPGVVFTGIRLFAKNPMLPHRQDFALVRWV